MWDLKYRPLTFADVLGQQGTVLTLKERLRNGSALNTSYVFGGGHGQGKTTLARILARAMLCTDLNKEDPEPCNKCDNCRDILNETSTAFFERDAASNGKVEHIRAIVDELPFAAFGAAKKIYLFDEAHRMSKEGQDVLLKPIEDSKMVAILCTTEPEKIRSAITSRCMSGQYTVRKVTREDVLVRMQKVLTSESVQYEDDAVLTVIDHSGGHVRDILNRLEMISQTGPVTLDNVREYLSLGTVTLYYDILLALGDPKQSIDLCEQACERLPPEDVSAGIAEAAMNSYRLANGVHADFAYVDRERAQKVYARFGPACLGLAEFFLRTRYPSRISLLCDVVRATSGGAPPPVMVAPPPVQILQQPTAVQVPTSSVETVALAPTVVLAGAPVVSAQPPPTAQPSVQAVSSVEDAKPAKARIGPLGSSDPMALTDLDPKAVPKDMPRRANTAVMPVVFPPTSLDGVDDLDLNLLTPEQWRHEFERTWPGNG